MSRTVFTEKHIANNDESAKKYNTEHRDDARKKAHYEEHKDKYKEHNKNYSAEYRKQRWLCPVCNVSMSFANK